jgi:hypothetical protein
VVPRWKSAFPTIRYGNGLAYVIIKFRIHDFIYMSDVAIFTISGLSSITTECTRTEASLVCLINTSKRDNLGRLIYSYFILPKFNNSKLL